jgi:hypothetical protein
MDAQQLADIGLSYFDQRRKECNVPVEYIAKWNEKHLQRFGVYSRDDRALLLSMPSMTTSPIDVPADQINVSIVGASLHRHFTAAHFQSMITRTQQRLAQLAPASHIHLHSGGSAWAGNVTYGLVDLVFGFVFCILF